MVEDNGRVVCVVDDDASLRRSLRNLLTSVGFRVETFQSAETFLETVHRENTGCVVLDLRMTGMNGLDLLRHLGATGSRIPVIILTAHGDDETRQRSLQAGAVAFLTKPFQSATLLDAVPTALSSAWRPFSNSLSRGPLPLPVDRSGVTRRPAKFSTHGTRSTGKPARHQGQATGGSVGEIHRSRLRGSQMQRSIA